jgi:hypothetical protein
VKSSSREIVKRISRLGEHIFEKTENDSAAPGGLAYEMLIPGGRFPLFA